MKLRRDFFFRQGMRLNEEGAYSGVGLMNEGSMTQYKGKIASRRSSEKEHKADALALGAEEGRDKLR